MNSGRGTETNTKDSSGASGSNGTIRWGIVGLGDVCQVKSGPAFWKVMGSELVAVMRRTPGKAAEFAKRVPGGKCVGYDNLESFLAHEGLDAVYISTRPGTHLELCQQVAAAGKACYVEKPVGRCAEETKQIYQIFSPNNKNDHPMLYTAYISRAYARTSTIKQLLYEEQVLGESLEKVTYTLIGQGGARDMDQSKSLPWRLQAEQSGGGLIMDVGCHIIDRLEYLCNGVLTEVQGRAENRNSPNQDVEDFVCFDASIGEPVTPSPLSSSFVTRGASVHCTWDFAGTQPKDELIFTGQKGSLIMAGMSPAGPVQFVNSNGDVVREWTFDVPEHTAQPMVQAVTNDLLCRRRQMQENSGDAMEATKSIDPILSFGENAIRTQQVLDACLESYYGGREIGYWTRQSTWPGRPED